ncbi:MAG TPA: hypothetical protein VGO56_15285 [Pyrinomonadaceae bacterium]|jgi:hypothetical protein|nr:hypothetical protein [Pyrinomonadaceae bacterium]
MSSLFLFDVPADPVSPLPWAALIVLLLIVFVLAVAFVAGLVVLLIRIKRRKVKAAGGVSSQ